MSILSLRRAFTIEVWVDEVGAPCERHTVIHLSLEDARQIAKWMFIDNNPEYDSGCDVHTSIVKTRDLLS